MSLSVFDLFSVGIGPSSSHTVGPMRAAKTYVDTMREQGELSRIMTVRVELFGSLGATGHGHGSVKAVTLGLAGYAPDEVDPLAAESTVEQISESGKLELGGGGQIIEFSAADDVILHRRKRLDFHPNGMMFYGFDRSAKVVSVRTYYSVGGGFVVDEDTAAATSGAEQDTPVPFPFATAAELLAHTSGTGRSISSLMMANEQVRRSEQEIRDGLLKIWSVMAECVDHGTEATGSLPGGLRVRRRAAKLKRQLVEAGNVGDPLHAMEWVTMFALAVNEENAGGGRVVTAPTNGAAGIIPAVLHYYRMFVPGASDDGVVKFLLTAGAIGMLFKQNASISGAEVGCQGEVGSACSMAAAGLAEALGGTPEQVENAAEIGIEHNLGLTCDPVGGLVQIPCIERNAIAAVKAITAARMSVRGDGVHHVSLDNAIKTMRETGADMKDKYKETSRGGLALNVVEC